MSDQRNSNDSIQGGNPVHDDLSIHVIPGRIKDTQIGIQEAQDAERIGFKRVWVPERYDIKEAGVTLSAMAANTKRIGIGTGPFTLTSRPPLVTAALGATMNALYGPRLTLGVARGDAHWSKAQGLRQLKYKELIEWVGIIQSLWRGESVPYEGAGGPTNLKIDDLPDIEMPKIGLFHIGGPLSSKHAANPVFNEIGLTPMLTPEAVYNSIEITRKECEATGRDFSKIKFIAPITSAPDLSEEETLNVTAARLLIYLQVPQLGEAFTSWNGWDKKVLVDLQNHPMFSDMKTELADGSFRREDLLDVAKLIPEEWITESCAVGSVDECVKRMQLYIDAGAHEIDFYGTTPLQNEELVNAWAEHKQTRNKVAN